jgi:hypothetical protein
MAFLCYFLLLVLLRGELVPFRARLLGASLGHHHHRQTSRRHFLPISQRPRMQQPAQSWS